MEKTLAVFFTMIVTAQCLTAFENQTIYGDPSQGRMKKQGKECMHVAQHKIFFFKVTLAKILCRKGGSQFFGLVPKGRTTAKLAYTNSA